MALKLAAEAVEKGEIAAEQFVRMLTVEVGHTDSDVVYTENALTLHRYEPDERRHETPILIVYALVNRPYILDLQPDRSVIRRLLEAGFPVYLIDWGEPSRLDANLGMDDYVTRYLDNCVDEVLADAGVEELHMLGYCMGGSMALMYASQTEEDLRTLTCMATPIAFDGTGGILERWAEHFDPDTAVETYGNMPGDVLAVEFSMMDPIEHYLTKYVRLYENLEDEAFVENFARMEKWIWDGVDVAGRAFQEFVGEVYQDNQLIRGQFDLDGAPVALSTIETPLCQIVGEYDHIVPAESSRPLNDLVASDDERLIEFPAGHIGISVSSRAHEELWPDVAGWLAERSDPVAGGDGQDAPPAPAGEPTAADQLDTAMADPEYDRQRARQSVKTVVRRAQAHVADEGVDAPGESVARERAKAAVADVARQAAGQTDSDGAGSPEGDAAPVQTVDGIGPTYADRLREAGIETVADLRGADAAEIADAADAPLGRAENWLDGAG
jgi:polyhydroxyalkanoate synthase